MIYLVCAATGAAIGFIAFPGRDRAWVCFLMALTGVMFAGAMDLDRNGDASPFAQVMDPLAQVLATAIGLQGADHTQSRAPCPADPHSGNYGPSVIYDDTIRIIGSQQFISRVVVALHRLHETPSYRYAKALRIIEEAALPRDRWAQVSGRHTLISPHASTRSCTFLAGTIVHEGAHVIHGSGHGPVYAAQAQALREMGEPRAAAEAERMAANY